MTAPPDFELTRHAVLRYIERQGGYQLQSEAEADLKALLVEAVPCDFNGNTHYYKNGDWTFVIDSPESVVITVWKR